MPVYLDHAATTPLLADVAQAMALQRDLVGNASSLHTAGRAARRVVEESRERLAGVLGARPSEVVFTSGGTEADNLAIAGVYRARRDADPRRRRLLVSAIEHHAVLDCVQALVDREGAEVHWLPVGPSGVLPLAAVREAIEHDPDSVALVSVMWANNEVGTVQNVAAIAAEAHGHGIPMHTDAVQAVGHLPVDFAASGVDLLTLTGHKLGGPIGAGALLVRREQAVVPLVHGGGQEMGLGYGIRPGGAWTAGDWSTRLAGNAHLLVPGCEGDSLLYLLDAAGIACSTGSACQAGVPQPSHVLLAMGLSEREARGALRLTLGHTSVPGDVAAVLAALPAAVERARRAAGVA